MRRNLIGLALVLALFTTLMATSLGAVPLAYSSKIGKGGYTTYGGGFTLKNAAGTSTIFSFSESTFNAALAISAEGAWERLGTTSGSIEIAPIAIGTNKTSLVNQAGGSAKVITLPAATCELPGLGLANTFTAANTFASTVTGPGGGSAVYRKLVTTTRLDLIAGGYYGHTTDAGIEILPAVAGRQYQVVNARVYVDTLALTATATATGVRLVSAYTLGATGTVLFDVPIANLVRVTTAGVGYNSMLPATTNNVLLADGASFAAQTANKSIILISVAGVDWLGTNAKINVDIEYRVL